MQNGATTTATPVSDPYRINGLVFDRDCNPAVGQVRWNTARSLWNGTMFLAAIILAPLYFSWSALVVFFCLCFVTLCCGHSVGFHRRLIHRSYKCPKWLERILYILEMRLAWVGRIGQSELTTCAIGRSGARTALHFSRTRLGG